MKYLEVEIGGEVLKRKNNKIIKFRLDEMSCIPVRKKMTKKYLKVQNKYGKSKIQDYNYR